MIQSQDAICNLLDIVRLRKQTGLIFTGDLGHFRLLLHNRDIRAACSEHSVEFAWRDIACEAGLQRQDEYISGCKRFLQPLLRLKRIKVNISEILLLDARLEK